MTCLIKTPYILTLRQQKNTKTELFVTNPIIITSHITKIKNSKNKRHSKIMVRTLVTM